MTIRYFCTEQLRPVGPRWAPCWPHKPCYQGQYSQVLLWHCSVQHNIRCDDAVTKAKQLTHSVYHEYFDHAIKTELYFYPIPVFFHRINSPIGSRQTTINKQLKITNMNQNDIFHIAQIQINSVNSYVTHLVFCWPFEIIPDSSIAENDSN